MLLSMLNIKHTVNTIVSIQVSQGSSQQSHTCADVRSVMPLCEVCLVVRGSVSLLVKCSALALPSALGTT